MPMTELRRIIDNLVEFWHNHYKGDKSLAQFLEMSDEEYAKWVENGEISVTTENILSNLQGSNGLS